MIHALFVPVKLSKEDTALSPGRRGDRKLLVTEVRPATERAAESSLWMPPAEQGKSPVLAMLDTECAVFNQYAKQTRHCHREGTELYLGIEGRMSVEVEGAIHQLGPGDLLVVLPGAYHQVLREGEFLSRVITVNCGGAKDRFEFMP